MKEFNSLLTDYGKRDLPKNTNKLIEPITTKIYQSQHKEMEQDKFEDEIKFF